MRINQKSGLIIAVSGGPGTGKSTLVRQLAAAYGATALFEGEEKDFPEEVRVGIKTGQAQLATRLYFRNKTFAQYVDALSRKAAGEIVILDNFWLVNEVCCHEFLHEPFERELMTVATELDRQMFPWPDLIISLKADAKKIEEFVTRRGRSFEINNDDFFARYASIHAKHDEYLQSFQIDNVLYVDRSKMDFKSGGDLASLLVRIEEKLKSLGKI
ncbi:MAG: deoxynucleoside kinase [Patescibacteria group bacterium]